jgi:hypothetical protein
MGARRALTQVHHAIHVCIRPSARARGALAVEFPQTTDTTDDFTHREARRILAKSFAQSFLNEGETGTVNISRRPTESSGVTCRVIFGPRKSEKMAFEREDEGHEEEPVQRSRW